MEKVTVPANKHVAVFTRQVITVSLGDKLYKYYIIVFSQQRDRKSNLLWCDFWISMSDAYLTQLW